MRSRSPARARSEIAVARLAYAQRVAIDRDDDLARANGRGGATAPSSTRCGLIRMEQTVLVTRRLALDPVRDHDRPVPAATRRA
jgi:hypothetical protein